jgi:hypothetical protein
VVGRPGRGGRWFPDDDTTTDLSVQTEKSGLPSPFRNHYPLSRGMNVPPNRWTMRTPALPAVQKKYL